jgi:FRG domain-containing protein
MPLTVALRGPLLPGGEMAIVIEQIDGVRGLVNRVLEISSDLPDGRFLWFRGLSRTTHTLVPKIMRDNKAAEDVFERETRLLTRFRQRSLAYWPSGYPQNDWEHLFAMQHYGMPTRLLDWSENLFVAAHFALASSVNDDQTQPAIWCTDPVAWNRATPALSEYGEAIHILTTADDEADSYMPNTIKRRGKTPVALFGTHNSQRIVAQRGTFMVWGNDARPLENFAEELDTNLWKLEVQGARPTLAAEMRALGFGETMVFPELPSLAAELSRTEGWRN